MIVSVIFRTAQMYKCINCIKIKIISATTWASCRAICLPNIVWERFNSPLYLGLCLVQWTDAWTTIQRATKHGGTVSRKWIRPPQIRWSRHDWLTTTQSNVDGVTKQSNPDGELDARLKRRQRRWGSGHFPPDIFPRTFPPPGQFPCLFTWCRTFPLPPPPSANLQYKAIYRYRVQNW